MAVNTGVGLSLHPRIPFGKGRGLRVCPSALLVLANAAHSLQPMTCSASGESISMCAMQIALSWEDKPLHT